MDKLKMQTNDKTTENFAKLAQLFPSAVTETIIDGEVTGAIDKDILMQEISAQVVEGKDQRYQFTWPEKEKFKRLASSSINKTLRPNRQESVNFDSTQNLYIEGDNLEVLKLLQETYLGKVKMIYIDPPYNTGKDFVYSDKWSVDSEQWDEMSGDNDEEGNQLFQNTATNGRFHTDWLNMMYPRLKLAKDLLTDDGVIFISIDDNEVHNLRKICDEIFGVWNFVGQINWKGRGGRQDSKHYAVIHEYILCYAKKLGEFSAGEEVKLGDVFPKYDEFKKRNYKTQLARKWGANSKRSDRPNLFYSITAPDGTELFPMLSENEEGRWRWSKSRMTEEINQGNIEFVKNEKQWIAYEKIYEPLSGEENTKKFTTWLDDIGVGTGTDIIKNLFNNKIFDYPKPIDLLKRFILMADAADNSIILDFFSGSATTAHAVMQLNAEDGGNRKFIMVQLPEECKEGSEAYKAGYKNICEIGKERIRRAGEKIKNFLEEAGHSYRKVVKDGLPYKYIDANEKEVTGKRTALYDTPENLEEINKTMGIALDIGFRVLKVDSSNMQDVYYYPDKVQQGQLDMFADNIKEDRTPEDLLFQVMLDLGILLSNEIKSEQIEGKQVFKVYQDGQIYLVACFDTDVSQKVVTEIAKLKPYYAVFRDSGMQDDSTITSFEQIFATYSPSTVRKVL